MLRLSSGGFGCAGVVTSRPDFAVAASVGPHGSGPARVGVVMVLRYPAVCPCGAELLVGTVAVWDRATRRVWCRPGADPGVTPPAAAPAPVVAGGGAGESLQRTYEARRAVREARVRAAHPRLGRLWLALSAPPASTTAFAKGAAGERRLAAELEAACGDRVLFLHNRRLGPRRRDGDLDHVAVCPGGVVVIDAKTLTHARVAVHRSGGLLGPVREQLVVSGRDRGAYLAGSLAQQAAVAAALTADDPLTGAGAVTVTGVLCFLDAVIDGWRWRPPRAGGVLVASATGTARLLRGPGPLGPTDRQVIWEHLDRRLPPA